MTPYTSYTAEPVNGFGACELGHDKLELGDHF